MKKALIKITLGFLVGAAFASIQGCKHDDDEKPHTWSYFGTIKKVEVTGFAWSEGTTVTTDVGQFVMSYRFGGGFHYGEPVDIRDDQQAILWEGKEWGVQ